MRARILAKLRMPDGTINPWVIAITVTLATFMEVLDTSIANVALPHIAGNLSAGQDESTWVLTSYLVSNAIVLPLSGWFSGLIGRKRFYMTCVAIFTVSSFLCGLAPSLGVLVIFRIFLGLGSMQIILDKGQREDWLSSNFIRVFFVMMLFGLIAGILWELREKEPVVDLRMLKDRNFAIATTAMFFLGFVLYSSTVLIPQLLQQLLGYTAQLAGMALSPGGAVIMCMMPVVGILVSKVDTRILLIFGCIVSSTALFVMAGWDLGLDFGHAVRARMLQSFGLAFLFIPINVAAFAYVPKEKTNMGTGIINLARNIGASVGIATVTTMLDRRAQFHQARLTEHVNNFSAAYHNMVNGIQVKLVAAGSTAAHASAQAHGMIYGTVQRQAVMLAFLDNFKMLGLVFFAVIPILAMMKKPKARAGSVPVH